MSPSMPSWEELKRRKLVQWALAYLAGAWVVLQLLDVVAEPWGIGSGLVLAAQIVLAFGFFATLVLAWYHGEQGRQRVSGPELLMLAALLVIAGGVMAMVRGGSEATVATMGSDPNGGVGVTDSDAAGPSDVPSAIDSDPTPARSVAVLPFENLSGEESNEYFSHGITEDILTALAKIGDLHVISRTSSMAYEDTDLTLREIGRELRVAHILEGSVRRQENRVRIVAQLVDAETDRHLWADSYDREIDDLFTIQSEIAEAIADALEAELTQSERERFLAGGTRNLDAYDLYLRGREIAREPGGGREGTERAIAHFRRALELDPEYALAHAGLARAYAIRQEYQGIAWGDSAILSAARAIARDPRAPEGYVAMADAQLWWGLHDRAIDNLQLALERSPNHADALTEMSVALQGAGRHDEALEWALRAISVEPTYVPHYGHIGELLDWLDADAVALPWYERRLQMAPEDPESYENFVYHHLDQGNFDRANEAVETMLRIDPEAPGTLHTAGIVAMHREDLDTALDLLERWYENQSRAWEPGEILGWLYARLGHADEAAAQLRHAENIARLWIGRGDQGSWPYVALATVQVTRGETDAAIRSLERAVERGGWRAWPLHSFRTTPVFDPLRSDPRFEALMERVDGRLERMREASDAESVTPPGRTPRERE